MTAKTQDPRFAMQIQKDGKVSTRNLNDILQVAKVAVDAGIVPNDMRDPVKVAVAIMTGAEVGVGAMFAIRNIAIINGRPTIWGDLGLALIQRSGTLEHYEEGCGGDPDDEETRYAWVKAKRRGQTGLYEGVFTWHQAKKAGLLGRKTYKEWLEDMLLWRARWRALRKGWADHLGGLIPREIIGDFPSVEEPDGPHEVPLEDFQSVSSDPIPAPDVEPEETETERLRREHETLKARMQKDVERELALDDETEEIPADAEKPHEGEEFEF